jgi:folate-binding protein YgfZ
MSVKLQINMVAGAPNFGDPRGEFNALVSGCGFYDLSSRAKFAITGKDRVRWLNGMVSNNIRDLQPGNGVYCFLLNPQGRIQGDLYAYNRGESLLLDVDNAQLAKVIDLLQHHIIMDQVTITDISSELTALGVAGPKAPAILRKLLGTVPDLQSLQSAEVAFQQAAPVLVSKDIFGVAGYELWLAPENVAALWDVFAKSGARPVGTEAVEFLRIASGVPRYGADIRERDLPQETGQTRALNFTKGCYIGQEIVERIRSRGNVHRAFSGFRVEGALPAPGAKILSAEKEVGEITSATFLPLADGDRPVALGYIRREAVESKAPLQAGDARLSIADFPFIQFSEQ